MASGIGGLGGFRGCQRCKAGGAGSLQQKRRHRRQGDNSSGKTKYPPHGHYNSGSKPASYFTA
ncbi:MAG: hypothetical protein ACHP79_16210 [Terriglobales bacterium]